jgi:hypothetical protein
MSAGVLCLFGCSKSAPPVADTTTTTPANPAVDTSKYKAAFVGAPQGLVGSAYAVIDSINATNYNEALQLAQSLAEFPKLTPAQKQATEDVIAKLKELGAKGTP